MSRMRAVRRISSGTITATLADYAPGSRMTTHAHPDVAVTLVISGRVDEAVRGRTHVAQAWSVGVKPFGIEHADEFGARGARLVCLSVTDPAQFETSEARRGLAAWRWATAGPAAPLLAGLAASLVAGRSGGAWLELLAMDVVAALAADGRARSPVTVPPWLQRVRSCCQDDPDRGVDTSALAAEAGLHPVTLARLFRQAFGESISDCVRRARVQRAAAHLADTETAIVDVAADAGCADQSHLTRLLRREAGLTPRRLRRLACCDRSRCAGAAPATVTA